MPEEQKFVAIDTDFFKKFTEDNPGGELFMSVMEDLGLKPIMHKYVYEEELIGDSTIKKLVMAGKVKIYNDEDYLSDDRRSYESMFKMAYESFNGELFDERKDIYTFRHAKRNLGEIRTALMALYMGIDIMMSDDKAAKSYITERISSRRNPIRVCNVYDALMMLGEKKGRKTEWSYIKGFAKKVLGTRSEKYDLLNNLWHS